MSSISFPAHVRTGAAAGAPDASFYADSFSTPEASFQMNPHSSHPPRTPRTSVMSSASHVYGADIYDAKDDAASTVDDRDVDEDADAFKAAEAQVRKEDVWREMFLTSNGRDKGFKLIQYSIRVLLFFHASVTTSRLLRRPKHAPWEQEAVKRLESTAAGLSTTRKLLLLFNWLTPLTAIMAQQSVPYSAEQSAEVSRKTTKPFLHTLLYAPPPVILQLVHALADDVATLSRLGMLGRRTGERAAHFSDWCWLLATLVGLVENGVERQMIGGLQREVEGRLYTESLSGATAKSAPAASRLDERELARLQRQDYWLQMTRAKLVMDLMFVSTDLFKITRGRDAVRTFTGLATAVISSAKLYDRHKSTLAKALKTALA